MTQEQPGQRRQQPGQAAQYRCSACGSAFNTPEQLRKHEKNCVARSSEHKRQP